MNIGIDYLGVIAGYGSYKDSEQKFASIIVALWSSGHCVFLISGAESDEKAQLRIDFLLKHGLSDRVTRLSMIPGSGENLVESIGRWKGAMCAEHKIDIMIEDDPRIAREIREASPGTIILRAYLCSDEFEDRRGTPLHY